MLAKLMVLHRQILFSLAIAAIAEVILMWASAEQVPSLHRIASRHSTLVTSANFWPFVLIICLGVVCVVGHDSVLFCADFYSICCCSVYKSSSPLLLPIRSMSSANRRLHVGLPELNMDVWWSWSVSCVILSRNKLNRMSESKHP